MKPLLQHLENESLLLLYMAGEMPAEDREELEVMLARDGGLRAQLASLRASQDVALGTLEALDLAEPPPAAEPAMRAVNRSMRQWQIDRLARPPKVAASRSKVPLLAWSAGSAVAALLVFCIWWGFRSDVVPIASTQPIGPWSGSDRVAQGSPSDAGLGEPMQIATVDSSTQRLAELESVVSEDLARE